MNEIERAMTSEDAIKNLTAYMYYALDEIPKDVGNAISTAISALRVQTERENPKPLTLEQLRERENRKSPVWLNKAKEWAFIASVNIEPYAQAWYFNSRALAKTCLFHHESFYDHPPKDDA